MTTTSPETRVCPAWCATSHTGDHGGQGDYRQHHSAGIHPRRGLYAAVSWAEPVTPYGRLHDRGPRVRFAAGDAGVLLTAQQATDLAAVMDEMGRGEEAALLRDALTLIGGAQ